MGYLMFCVREKATPVLCLLDGAQGGARGNVGWGLLCSPVGLLTVRCSGLQEAVRRMVLRAVLGKMRAGDTKVMEATKVTDFLESARSESVGNILF
jgi:hypothetical protein